MDVDERAHQVEMQLRTLRTEALMKAHSTLVLLNGGAAVGIGTFIGQAWKEGRPVMLGFLLASIVVFALGVLCIAGASYYRYEAAFDPASFQRSGKPRWRAMLLLASSAGAFFVGMLLVVIGAVWGIYCGR